MRGAVFAGTFLLLLEARERTFNESPAAGFRDLINSGFVYWRFVIFSSADSSPCCPKLFTRLINVKKMFHFHLDYLPENSFLRR